MAYTVTRQIATPVNGYPPLKYSLGERVTDGINYGTVMGYYFPFHITHPEREEWCIGEVWVYMVALDEQSPDWYLCSGQEIWEEGDIKSLGSL